MKRMLVWLMLLVTLSSVVNEFWLSQPTLAQEQATPDPAAETALDHQLWLPIVANSTGRDAPESTVLDADLVTALSSPLVPQ